MGRAVAELCLKQARAKDTAATLTLPDIRRIGQFHWLLTEDEALEVTTMTDALLKDHLEGPPVGCASSSAGVGLLKLETNNETYVLIKCRLEALFRSACQVQGPRFICCPSVPPCHA